MMLNRTQDVEISFVVATYNRNATLKNCLNSFMIQNNNLFEYEVLVIDNAVDAVTMRIVEEFSLVNPKIKYIGESKIGRSVARNTGIKMAKGQWIVFIDDDAELFFDYFDRLIFVINNFDFDCFGGMYHPKYYKTKPKWISNEFGKKVKITDSVERIFKPYLSLGNFAVKESLIKLIGSFDGDFGAGGGVIGYGEENVAQIAMLGLGYKLGFDPELKIDHAVLPHKLKLSWHLASWYAHGRDGQRFSGEPKFLQITWLFMRSFLGGLIKLPINIGKLFVKRDYFWQNLVWDVVSPMLFRIGQLVGIFK